MGQQGWKGGHGEAAGQKEDYGESARQVADVEWGWGSKDQDRNTAWGISKPQQGDDAWLGGWHDESLPKRAKW
jgi:hypothetical protein